MCLGSTFSPESPTRELQSGSLRCPLLRPIRSFKSANGGKAQRNSTRRHDRGAASVARATAPNTLKKPCETRFEYRKGLVLLLARDRTRSPRGFPANSERV